MTHKSESASKADYHTDPFVIFYIKSELRLVTDLQKNVKAMQNQAYARKVKIGNLQQMANTLVMFAAVVDKLIGMWYTFYLRIANLNSQHKV